MPAVLAVVYYTPLQPEPQSLNQGLAQDLALYPPNSPLKSDRSCGMILEG